MEIKEVRNALTAILKKEFPGKIIRQSDASRPMERAEFRVDIPSFSCEKKNGCSRTKSVEVEIWYYAKNADAPRDELEETAQNLNDLLFGGFQAGEIWLCPVEGLEFSLHQENSSFSCQFHAEWVEFEKETDAPFMEKLNLKGV